MSDDPGSTKPQEVPTAAAATGRPWQAWRAAWAGWCGPGPAVGRKGSSEELAQDRTDMAAARTMMAADRTLMAWVRTSFSMTSFGFTIYKVLQGFAESGATLPHDHTPRYFGLLLTGFGTLAMVMGAVEYAQALRALRRYMDVRLARPVLVMAVLMALMGLFFFFGIVTRLF
jgi:putative membrane protein